MVNSSSAKAISRASASGCSSSFSRRVARVGTVPFCSASAYMMPVQRSMMDFCFAPTPLGSMRSTKDIMN